MLLPCQRCFLRLHCPSGSSIAAASCATPKLVSNASNRKLGLLVETVESAESVKAMELAGNNLPAGMPQPPTRVVER